MKKLLVCILALTLLCLSARAETARDYALWLEEALPGAAFADAEIPEFVTRHLGADYDFIARTDEQYGAYIAGVRRADAPALPEGAHQTSYAGTFGTPVFQAADAAGNILYQFVLARNVYMQAYDGLKHLVIWIDDPNGGETGHIFPAALPGNRAALLYSMEKGWNMKDHLRCQLAFPIHSMESWQAGATDQPTHFYLDMTPPENLLGEQFLEEEDLIQYARIPIGLQLRDEDATYELVLSKGGALGVEGYGPHHRLYEAGPGCEALLDLAQKVLGYRPGEMDFTGKEIKRASLQWQGGRCGIAMEENLRRLESLLNSADFTVGSVNCPSPCFLTVDYSDGSSADFAVAINSFDLFFYNGMYFTAGEDGELLDIFMMKAEEIYVQE